MNETARMVLAAAVAGYAIGTIIAFYLCGVLFAALGGGE